ncbi:MAG: glucose-1-phosphate adenylyltransferase subunit GlgD [Clostridia bacterium]|nr:glucose-1-phosphate adenylyltransferase subunit GlgD [Clostridia bacterium]
MKAAGLVFSHLHDDIVPELTKYRTMASVPFGGRYRLIDFTLSNMVNAGIDKVGIITNYNYRSLLDHIGTGKDWDLARRSGGIKLLSPFITAYNAGGVAGVYSTRLEAMLSSVNFISECSEDVVVCSDCDIICNIDLSRVIAYHLSSGADITLVTKRSGDVGNVTSRHSAVICDGDGRITDVHACTPDDGPDTAICTNIMVISRAYLLSVLGDAAAYGYTSFFRDIMSRNVGRANYRAFPLDGFYAIINSMAGYFECSMSLLDGSVRRELFGTEGRPVYTKVRNSAPSLFLPGSSVTNSLVADGCVIEGEVRNSVIFRGVRIARGTKVENSVIMQDGIVGGGCSLNCVVADKNAVIRDGRVLSGHGTMPFFIGKGIMV